MRISPTKISLPLIAAALLLSTAPAHAQMRALNDAVVAHPDPESLFTSPDPKLHRNKQTALKIVKELLEANHWDRAPLYLTDRYIQHNPMAAEGDFVTVSFVREVPYPDDPTKTYTTTWFDMWRFVDGKADEHWDPATLPASPPPAAAPAAAPAAPTQPVPPPAG